MGESMGAFLGKIADFFTESAQHLPTDDYDGTQAIGLSFIFLAYILHPAIESAYHRIRAYRAWRAIEKRQAVEVTSYSNVSEIFGARGKWDTPRFITATLLAFNLASWGLELTMDLYSLDGEAYLLTQPPPVFRIQNGNESTWHVSLFPLYLQGYSTVAVSPALVESSCKKSIEKAQIAVSLSFSTETNAELC